MTILPTVLAGLLASTFSQTSTVPTVLLLEDDLVPGDQRLEVQETWRVETNDVGGYAALLTVQLPSGAPFPIVWGNRHGGTGRVLRTAPLSTAADFGFSNLGEIAYTLQPGTVFIDEIPIAVPGAPSPVPGKFWCQVSDVGMLGIGEPFFSASLSSDPSSGICFFGGIFVGRTPRAVWLEGQSVPGLSGTISRVPGLRNSFDFSEDGTRQIAILSMNNSTDALVLDGSGLVLGNRVLEGTSVSPSIGGLPGETWGSLNWCGVSNNGSYYFTALTTLPGGQRSGVLVVDGQITRRLGDTVDGVTLVYPDIADSNDTGDVVINWQTGFASSALLLNGSMLVRDGDPVDLDGDGVAEPNALLSGIWSRGIAISAREADRIVSVYFIADVRIAGLFRTALVRVRSRL